MEGPSISAAAVAAAEAAASAVRRRLWRRQGVAAGAMAAAGRRRRRLQARCTHLEEPGLAPALASHRARAVAFDVGRATSSLHCPRRRAPSPPVSRPGCLCGASTPFHRARAVAQPVLEACRVLPPAPQAAKMLLMRRCCLQFSCLPGKTCVHSISPLIRSSNIQVWTADSYTRDALSTCR